MITFTKSYKTEDGSIFGTIEEAQKYELRCLVEGHPVMQSVELPKDWGKTIATIIMDNRDVVLDILTTTPTSKPAARKINGGSKKRKTNKPMDLDGLDKP